MKIQLFDLTRDLAAIRDLYAACFAEPPWCERFDMNELDAWFTEMTEWPDAIFLVGTEGDRIVAGAIGFNVCRKPGICELIGDTDRNSFYIAELFVDPTYRERGACQKLNEHMLRLASLFGYRRGSVRTSVSQPVIQHVFINKLGFEIVSRQDVVSTKWIDGVEQEVPDTRVIMTGTIRDYLAKQRLLEVRGFHSGH